MPASCDSTGFMAQDKAPACHLLKIHYILPQTCILPPSRVTRLSKSKGVFEAAPSKPHFSCGDYEIGKSIRHKSRRFWASTFNVGLASDLGNRRRIVLVSPQLFLIRAKAKEGLCSNCLLGICLFDSLAHAAVVSTFSLCRFIDLRPVVVDPLYSWH